jgi:hypothetical protein
MVVSSKTLSFADPLPYQAAIRAADLELFPIARGDFHAELTQVCLNRLWMQSAQEMTPRICVGTTSPDRKIIGFLNGKNDPGMTHCGMKLSPDEIVVNSNDVLHWRTEAECDWGSMSVALDDFGVTCKAITGHELPQESLLHVVSPDISKV